MCRRAEISVRTGSMDCLFKQDIAPPTPLLRNDARGVEFRSIWKVASTSFRKMLDCEGGHPGGGVGLIRPTQKAKTVTMTPLFKPLVAWS